MMDFFHVELWKDLVLVVEMRKGGKVQKEGIEKGPCNYGISSLFLSET